MALAEIVPHDAPDALRAIAKFLASHPDSTSDTYRRALELVPLAINGTRDLASVPWHDLDHAAVCAVRERLARSYRPATVNRTLRALRSLARELAREGVISRERLTYVLEAHDIRQPWTHARVGRALAADEQQRVMSEAARTNAPRFHTALVALLLAGGLRRTEAATFLESDLSDYDPTSGRLIVHGKGRKRREVYFAGTAKAALDSFVAGDDRGWRHRKLRTSQIGRVLRRLEQRARVAHFTPHDCRRTYASTQLGRGVDIATVQALMGHASPAQTAAYDRRGSERLRAAAFDPWAK